MSEHSRLSRRRGWLCRFDRGFASVLAGQAGWGLRSNKELPILPDDPDEAQRIAVGASVADFWQGFQRHFAGQGSQPSVLGFRRFQSAATGAPETALGDALPPCLPGVDGDVALHLQPSSLQALNEPDVRAVWKAEDGSPELYAAMASNVEAGRAGRAGMPRQDKWDSAGSNKDFEASYTLAAEPLREEDSPHASTYTCPAPLVGYGATESSLILGLAEQVQDPRFSLACGTSNFQPGYNNLFSSPVFGPTWARWAREGPPDDTDFQMTEGMDGIHLAVAHWTYSGQIPAFERAMQQLGRHFQQLQLACQTRQDDQSVILEDFPLGATLLLGTSYDLEYDKRRYVEVLEMWTSHLLRRLADAIYNFFGVSLQDTLRNTQEHSLDFVSRILKEHEFFVDDQYKDWTGELWLGLNIWLDATSQLLSACFWLHRP
jgi:hypothetical protein